MSQDLKLDYVDMGAFIVLKWQSPFSGQRLVADPVNGYIRYNYTSCDFLVNHRLLSRYPTVWILLNIVKC